MSFQPRAALNRVFRRFTSLKSRMMLIMLVALPLTFLIFIFTAFRYTTAIIDDRLYNSFQVTLNNSGQQLEDCMDEIHAVSSSLVYSDSQPMTILKGLYFTPAAMPLDEAQRQLNNLLIAYEFSSSSIGLIAIVDVDNNSLFACTESGMRSIAFETLPQMYTANYHVQFHYPHKSFDWYTKNAVISLYRPFLTDVYGHEFALYIESEPRLMENIIQPEYESNAVSLKMDKALLSPDGEVILHSASAPVPTSSTPVLWPKETQSQYNILTYESQYWTLYGFADRAQYHQIMRPIYWHVIVSMFALILLNILIYGSIWKMVYAPIRSFTSELRSMSSVSIYNPIDNVDELDEFRQEFNKMRHEIQRLIVQTEAQAKKNSEIATQLLLSRINPHFLHNALGNIIQLSRECGDYKVSELLTALSHLLYYNLGKQRISTLQDDLNAARDYLLLQNHIRPFRYEIDVQVSESVLATPFPCFILQPLIENSILHGYHEDLSIRVSIHSIGERVYIRVQDNGRGIPAEILVRLQEQLHNSDPSSMGIGLRYVFASLKLLYANNMTISIDSVPSVRTSFVISVPRTLPK